MPRYRTYTLRVEWDGTAAPLTEDEQNILDDSTNDAADAVNDALPDGYYCKIDGPHELNKRETT
jgi:hypothetical protein